VYQKVRFDSIAGDVMSFTENLKKNNIILKSAARTRWELIEEIVDLAVRNHEISEEDKDIIRDSLVEREKSMSTGIGNGVAIPHCTTTKLQDMTVLMALSQKGIDFDAIDNNPVRIVVCLLVPKSKLSQHIKTLASIAKMMGDRQIRDKLLTLKSADSIMKTIQNYRITK